ncbi:MAG: hypothetical protein QM655_04780 [Nocardioidaceae bacterium]
MRRTATALAAVVIGTSLPVAIAPHAVAGDHQTSKTCKTSDFKTKIRHVTGKQSIQFSRIEAKTYPGDTTISKSQKVTVKRNKVLKVSLGYHSTATIGASALLKKVVKAYAKVTGGVTLNTAVTSTKTESKTVSSSVKMKIPGGTSVAWFRGWRYVGGTFQYSWCHHYSGMPEGYGVKTWTDSKFTTYGYQSSGGQRCDLKPTEVVAKAAKKAVCV